MLRPVSTRMLQSAWNSTLRQLVAAFSYDLDPSTDGRSKATLHLFRLQPMWHGRQAHPVWLATQGLNRHDERDLVLGPSAWFARGALAAEEGCIHLHATAQMPICLGDEQRLAVRGSRA
jgi:hypothetical protein